MIHAREAVREERGGNAAKSRGWNDDNSALPGTSHVRNPWSRYVVATLAMVRN